MSTDNFGMEQSQKLRDVYKEQVKALDTFIKSTPQTANWHGLPDLCRLRNQIKLEQIRAEVTTWQAEPVAQECPNVYRSCEARFWAARVTAWMSLDTWEPWAADEAFENWEKTIGGILRDPDKVRGLHPDGPKDRERAAA